MKDKIQGEHWSTVGIDRLYPNLEHSSNEYLTAWQCWYISHSSCCSCSKIVYVAMLLLLSWQGHMQFRAHKAVLLSLCRYIVYITYYPPTRPHMCQSSAIHDLGILTFKIHIINPTKTRKLSFRIFKAWVILQMFMAFKRAKNCTNRTSVEWAMMNFAKPIRNWCFVVCHVMFKHGQIVDFLTCIVKLFGLFFITTTILIPQPKHLFPVTSPLQGDVAGSKCLPSQVRNSA